MHVVRFEGSSFELFLHDRLEALGPVGTHGFEEGVDMVGRCASKVRSCT